MKRFVATLNDMSYINTPADRMEVRDNMKGIFTCPKKEGKAMRKTLIKLLRAPCESELEGRPGSCPDRIHGQCGEVERLGYCAVQRLADHLIANGVTVQQWIPVTERTPELVPCSAGTGYSEAVNVLTTGRKVLTAIWDGTDFIADAEFWDADGEEITHWTPVILPLPVPPKEG